MNNDIINKSLINNNSVNSGSRISGETGLSKHSSNTEENSITETNPITEENPVAGKINKQNVAKSFSKAAADYDKFAFIQREIGDRLFDRLSLMTLQPKIILDVGCGTGHYTRALKKHYRKAQVHGVDIAPGMIELADDKNGWLKNIGIKQCHYHCSDMNQLPFDDASVDLLFSNLALQWSDDLQATFAEFARVLKPEGLIIFSTLGPDTLIELKKAWQAADQSTHVNQFIDMHIIGDELIKAGVADPVMDMEKLTFTYSSVADVFKDLKGIGAHNMNAGRHTGLMSKGKWQAMLNAYNKFKNEQDLFPATYETIFGHGWGNQFKSISANQSGASDVYKVSLEKN